MEEKKNNAPRNEGANEGGQRISVRPGNFYVPGEAPKAARPQNVPDTRPAQGGQAPQNAQGGGRRNRHRGRHGDRPQRTPDAQNVPQNAQNMPQNTANATAPMRAENANNRNGNAESRNGQTRNGNGETRNGNGNRFPRNNRDNNRSNRNNNDNNRNNRNNNGNNGNNGNNRNRNNNGNGNRNRDDRAERTAGNDVGDTLRRELDEDFNFNAASLSSLSFSSAAKPKAEREEADPAVELPDVDVTTAAYLTEDVPTGLPTPDTVTVEVVGVRFRGAGKMYYFAPGKEKFRIGEHAVVDTARGEELGEIVMLNRKLAERDVIQPLRAVLRRATAEDIAHEEENRKKESEALVICAEKIAAHKLDMRLVDAQYAFDNSKLLFYFTSEGRVDFRELVRDLAGVFHTRIELRQIGIRDESRLIGGLGMCGRPFCCATYLSDFGQVSIKMAKEQGMSINTSKISGCCGRLMCCLRYEHETYLAETRLTPQRDTVVDTPDGRGIVTEAAPIAGTVKVRLDAAAEEPPRSYRRENVTPVGREKNGKRALSLSDEADANEAENAAVEAAEETPAET